MNRALSHWDLSIGIILLLNIASHYSTVHPMNIQCRFICTTEWKATYAWLGGWSFKYNCLASCSWMNQKCKSLDSYMYWFDIMDNLEPVIYCSTGWQSMRWRSQYLLIVGTGICNGLILWTMLNLWFIFQQDGRAWCSIANNCLLCLLLWWDEDHNIIVLSDQSIMICTA